MALKPENPVVGGTVLRRAAIQSPNYVTGVSGWTINQDGSVEFNNGVFRGTLTAATFIGTNFVINSAGAFFYSGAPAAGNLVASAAGTAGADGFGNNYLAGQAAYGGGFAAAVAAGFVTLYSGSLAGGWSAKGTITTSASGQGLILTAATGILLADATEITSLLVDGDASMNSTAEVLGTLTVGNGAASSLVFSPKIATPPNTAAVKAGTATLAQTEACLGGLIGSFQTRGMVT